MQRIVTHIERLLLTNDCVIIPEFGGFVLHPCPAVYKSEEHKFCPPGKGIVFNPTLNHHDRLLLDSYIQMYGMTFEKARISLKKDIEKLYHTIDNEGSVYFDKIGFLKRGDDWNLCFDPEQDSTFVGLKPYGLYTFHLPPVIRDEQKEKTKVTQTVKPETKHKNIVYLPVNRYLIRAVGVSAAAVALFLIISTPVKDTNRAAYSASFIPTELKTTNVSDLPKDTIQESTFEIDMANPIATSEETVIQPVVVPTQPMVKTVEASTTKTYYAIIASFASETHANQFIQQLNMPELANMGIVTNEERVRVYAEKFDKRDDAQNCIHRLRSNKKLKDTWLYIQ